MCRSWASTAGSSSAGHPERGNPIWRANWRNSASAKTAGILPAHPSPPSSKSTWPLTWINCNQWRWMLWFIHWWSVLEGRISKDLCWCLCVCVCVCVESGSMLEGARKCASSSVTWPSAYHRAEWTTGTSPMWWSWRISTWRRRWRRSWRRWRTSRRERMAFHSRSSSAPRPRSCRRRPPTSSCSTISGAAILRSSVFDLIDGTVSRSWTILNAPERSWATLNSHWPFDCEPAWSNDVDNLIGRRNWTLRIWN